MTDLEIIEEYRSIEKDMASLMQELNKVSDEMSDKCTDLRNRIHTFRYGEGEIFGQLDFMMSKLESVKDNFCDIYNKSVEYTEQEEDEYI